jgi:hypothetical protein
MTFDILSWGCSSMGRPYPTCTRLHVQSLAPKKQINKTITWGHWEILIFIAKINSFNLVKSIKGQLIHEVKPEMNWKNTFQTSMRGLEICWDSANFVYLFFLEKVIYQKTNNIIWLLSFCENFHRNKLMNLGGNPFTGLRVGCWWMCDPLSCFF